MFFNYDSLLVVGSVIVFGIFTYSFYNNIFTTINNSESLVNTLPSENTTPIPIPEPIPHSVLDSSNINKVDVGVQTDVTSFWLTIKNWFLNAFCIRSSEIESIGYNNVQ